MPPRKTSKKNPPAPDAPAPAAPPAEAALPEPKWPVEKASDLTIDHIPPQLRDEVTRPLIRAGQVVGQFALRAMDLRNDIMTGMARLEKEGNKDSASLNQLLGSAEFQAALHQLGLNGVQDHGDARPRIPRRG